jgi:hypothetical protein
MVGVSWILGSDEASSECAILMEIWDSGAVLQTDTAIPKNSIVTLGTPNGPVDAKVSSCKQDDYGFLIEVTVNPSERWFPKSYQPVYLMATSSV